MSDVSIVHILLKLVSAALSRSSICASIYY